MKYTFEVYKSKNQFYWRLLASNGRIVADSAEGYHRKQTCTRFIKNLQSIILDGRTDAIQVKDLT